MIKIVFGSVRESERFIALSSEAKQGFSASARKARSVQKRLLLGLKRNATRSGKPRKAAVIFFLINK